LELLQREQAKRVAHDDRKGYHYYITVSARTSRIVVMILAVIVLSSHSAKI